MPVSDEYIAFILDQLGGMGAVQARRMFGGVGLTLYGDSFGLIADNTLYLKVGDTNRKEFEDAGMGPFRPYPDKSATMSYYEVPGEVLENSDALCDWACRALEAGLRSKQKKSRKKKRS